VVLVIDINTTHACHEHVTWGHKGEHHKRMSTNPEFGLKEQRSVLSRKALPQLDVRQILISILDKAVVATS
jgi:hypothetical protein